MEFFGELIGEGSWDPPGGCTGGAMSILAEFVDGSLSVLLGADHDDLGGVGDGGNDSGSEFDSGIGLINVEDVVADRILLGDILFHVMVDFASAEMNLQLRGGIPWRRADEGCHFA